MYFYAKTDLYLRKKLFLRFNLHAKQNGITQLHSRIVIVLNAYFYLEKF